jgi:hypothetical protein
MTQNFYNDTDKKTIFLKTKYRNFFPKASRRTVQEKPSSVKIEHPALQNMKFLNLFLFLFVKFLLSWIWIQPTKINVDSSGSGNTSLPI